MKTFDNIEDVYKLIDRYVQLNFLVRLLSSHSTKNAEEFNSSVYDIDFIELGLDESIAKKLGSSPNITQLKTYKKEITNLATEASTQVFVSMSSMTNEMKLAAKEYVDSRVSLYLNSINECQEKYLELVVEIDKSTQEEDSNKTRTLGKQAKSLFNKIYEYNIICQNYSNISSYLNGMTRGIPMKK